MRKANPAKALLFLTLFFIALAVASFAAFQKTETVCSEQTSCANQKPLLPNGGILWDIFFGRLIAFAGL